MRSRKLLVIVSMVFLLCACGSREPQQNKGNEATATDAKVETNFIEACTFDTMEKLRENLTEEGKKYYERSLEFTTETTKEEVEAALGEPVARYELNSFFMGMFEWGNGGSLYVYYDVVGNDLCVRSLSYGYYEPWVEFDLQTKEITTPSAKDLEIASKKMEAGDYISINGTVDK